jgi:hypothetical protein
MFVKYLTIVDFTDYSPKNMYASSMSALCSCHQELTELTELATGVAVEFTEFKQFNVAHFKREPFQREVHEWLEGDLLPSFG